MELDRISADDFRPHVGSTVTLRTEGGEAFDLEVFNVRQFEDAPRPGMLRAGFTVELKGPAGLRIPQQIYRFEHAVLGSADVFVVPVAPDMYGSKFEMLFN